MNHPALLTTHPAISIIHRRSSCHLSSGGLGFHESIDIMDFGISQNGLRAALGESERSCSSLDDGTKVVTKEVGGNYW